MIEEINKTLEVLKKGGIILYPTDSLWGIGCDATNAKAVERIYAIIGRTGDRGMPVLLDTPNRIPSYVNTIPDVAWDLLEAADSPITIVYPEAKNLPENLLAADGSIGIRITNDPFCVQLIARLKKPIVSASANRMGQAFPSGFHEIDPELKNQVDYVVNHPQQEHRKAHPSGIIKLGPGGEVRILRQ